MPIDYSGFTFGKGRPRVAMKLERRRDLAKEERECRAKADTRDNRRCFFPGCRKRAGEKHHILSRSARGKTVWRTDDILSACGEHHAWFKAGLIYVTGNPDKGPVRVHLTALGREEGIRIPQRKAA